MLRTIADADVPPNATRTGRTSFTATDTVGVSWFVTRYYGYGDTRWQARREGEKVATIFGSALDEVCAKIASA